MTFFIEVVGGLVEFGNSGNRIVICECEVADSVLISSFGEFVDGGKSVAILGMPMETSAEIFMYTHRDMIREWGRRGKRVMGRKFLEINVEGAYRGERYSLDASGPRGGFSVAV